MSDNHDDFDEIDAMVAASRDRWIANYNAGTDFDAVFADIYANAGDPDGRGSARSPESGDGGVEAVCEHIDMLEAVLAGVTKSSTEVTPFLGTAYLTTVRTVLFQLREGLIHRRLTEAQAARLTGSVRHNLQQTDQVLRHQRGLSLEEAVGERIGELEDLSSDLLTQLDLLERKVMLLFDHTDDRSAPVPSPQH